VASNARVALVICQYSILSSLPTRTYCLPGGKPFFLGRAVPQHNSADLHLEHIFSASRLHLTFRILHCSQAVVVIVKVSDGEPLFDGFATAAGLWICEPCASSGTWTGCSSRHSDGQVIWFHNIGCVC
jgi:hypothetical protein